MHLKSNFPDYDPDHPLFWEFPAIPKIIHQLWVGPRPRPQRLLDTWKNAHPDWEYVLWTEENLKDFRFKNQKQIDAMPEWNGKADIMRYEILDRFGGVFMDADSECLNPLDPFFLNNDSFSVYENEKQRGGLIACGIMGAVPNCLLMKLCVDELSKIEVKSPAWWYCGPVFFTWVIQTHNYPIHVYPSHYFLPNHYTGECYAGTDKIYALHKWGTTTNNYEVTGS